MSKLGHMEKNTTEAWFSSLQDAAERINLHPRTLPVDRLASGTSTPTWVPLSVAGERLSLHERTIRRAITAGELPGYKIGKALRVRLDELDAWAAAKVMPNPRTTRPTLSGGASL